MRDKYEHIANASDERLAEMLEEHNRWRRGEKPYDKFEPMPFDAHELGLIIEEAAKRLRNIQRVLDSKLPFNHEQFNI